MCVCVCIEVEFSKTDISQSSVAVCLSDGVFSDEFITSLLMSLIIENWKAFSKDKRQQYSGTIAHCHSLGLSLDLQST